MASIFLSKLNFSSVGGTGKGEYEAESGNEYYKNYGQYG